MVVLMTAEAGETEIDGVVDLVRSGRRRLREPRMSADDRRPGVMLTTGTLNLRGMPGSATWGGSPLRTSW